MIEKTLISKMTFYDIVTLIIPGTFVCSMFDWFPFANKGSWVGYVALFGIVLLIGLVLKGISSWWSSLWFRNNTKMIQNIEENDTNIIRNLACVFICAPVLYLFSFFSVLFHRQDKELLRKYYDKYDNAYIDVYGGKRIELLEAQVAFLQTFSWALALCLIYCVLSGLGWVSSREYAWAKEWWLFTIGIYVCIISFVVLQKKVYLVVSETIEKERTFASRQDKEEQYNFSEFWSNLSEHSTSIALIVVVLFTLISMPVAFLCERPRVDKNSCVTIDSTQVLNVKLVNEEIDHENE